MKFIVEKNRVYYEENGEILAGITFIGDEDVLTINHTFVDDRLRGQGIASKLVQEAVTEIKRQNKKVQASCSYAVKWLEKHPEA